MIKLQNNQLISKSISGVRISTIQLMGQEKWVSSVNDCQYTEIERHEYLTQLEASKGHARLSIKHNAFRVN